MKSNTNLVYQHLLWRGLYFFSVLLINIGIARYFAAEKSGQIFYIVNNLALVLLIVSISLESGSSYYVASGSLNASQMARFCGFWALATSLLATVGWWIILYSRHSIYLKETGFLLSGFLFILGVLLTTYFTALFYAKKEFGLPNKLLFLINILLIIILITGKNNLAFRSHFIHIYFSFFFLQGLLLMIFFFNSQPNSNGSRIPSGDMLKKVFRYSLAALLANGIYFLVNRIDYWFVQYYCTANDLGNYIQASKLAQMLFVLPGILASTLFPIFSSGEKKENTRQLAAVMRILFLINGIVCIGILCAGWYLIPLIFGTSFDNMYLLFVLLIPGILCVTLNYPLAAWFSASKQIEINIRGALLALIVICAGDLILLPRYGVMSASLVSSAGFICYYCYTVFMYRKINTVSWKDLIMIRTSDLNEILRSLRSKRPDATPENPIV